MRMESKALQAYKPTTASSYEEKQKFIQMKYAQASRVSKRNEHYSIHSSDTESELSVVLILDSYSCYSDSVTFIRANKFSSIYFLQQILHALSLSESVWQVLVGFNFLSSVLTHTFEGVFRSFQSRSGSREKKFSFCSIGSGEDRVHDSCQWICFDALPFDGSVRRVHTLVICFRKTGKAFQCARIVQNPPRRCGRY